jgi:hypothetical protein
MNLYGDAKRANRHYWYNNNPTQATGLDPNAMDISAVVLGGKPNFYKKPQNQTGLTNSAVSRALRLLPTKTEKKMCQSSSSSQFTGSNW